MRGGKGETAHTGLGDLAVPGCCCTVHAIVMHCSCNCHTLPSPKQHPVSVSVNN